MSPAVLHLPGIAPASAARLWAMDPARWAAWLEDPRAGGVAMLASAEGRTRSYGYSDREAFREDLAALGGEALAVRGVRAVCFLAYEAAAWFERVPQPKAPVPCLAWLHQPSVSVHFDTAGATIVADSSAQAEEVARALKQGAAGRAPQCEVAWGSISAQPDPEGFCAAVRQVKDYIAAGDIFQANIARFFSAPFPQDALEALYWRLRAVNPAPFAGFVRLGEGRYLLSSSPERLIRIQGRRIEARPIAGTRRRAQGARDRLLERELLLSEKERAEHVMLVDLVRNDLGRVCAYGTV
ncbi:MAG: aminodeoxychorismate synthase component I, partial [Zetaproteobacteria bacterium]